MGRFAGLWEWVALLFVVAAIYILVRPRSGAADLVTALGDFAVAVVRQAVDLGAPSSG